MVSRKFDPATRAFCATARRLCGQDAGGNTFGETSSVVSAASDDDSFLLVTQSNGQPGGSILSAPRLRNGTWITKDFAASAENYYGARVEWDGTHYLVVWSVQGSSVSRASRLTADGDSIDGERTEWRGFEFVPPPEQPRAGAVVVSSRYVEGAEVFQARRIYYRVASESPRKHIVRPSTSTAGSGH